MEIIWSNSYERDGNDSWLTDSVTIFKENGKLILRHKKTWDGWNGKGDESNEITLLPKPSECQRQINLYLRKCFILDYFKIKVKDIM